MSVFQGIIGFLALLPYIVTGAEKLHEGKTGEQKKQAVMQIAGAALAGVASADPHLSIDTMAAVAGIGGAVDSVVATLNALGVLKHSAPAGQ